MLEIMLLESINVGRVEVISHKNKTHETGICKFPVNQPAYLDVTGVQDDTIVDLEYLDDIVAVPDGDAILMAQKLASSLGLGVGISSGANLLGALAVQNQLGADSVVVTMLPDSNKKYLSTDLMREEPILGEYLTPDVQLLGFRGFKRVCRTCCDQEECDEFIAATCKFPACEASVRISES